MRFHFQTAAFLITVLIQTSAGQTPGPVVTGFLYDASARELKPILGVPGAAHLAAGIVEDLDWASASPDKNTAVGVRGGHTIVITGLRSMEPREIDHLNLLPSPNAVAWSTRGRVAVLYSSEQNALQVLRIGASMIEEAPISLRSVEGSVGGLTITDSGRVIFAAGANVYVASDAALEVRWHAPATTAIASCGDRIFATSAGVLLELTADGNVRRPFDADFVASGVSCAGKNVVTVDTQTPAIVGYDPAGVRVLEVPLDRRPSMLTPVQTDAVFLLNGTEEDRLPAIVLDVTRTPAVFFVPRGMAGAL